MLFVNIHVGCNMSDPTLLVDKWGKLKLKGALEGPEASLMFAQAKPLHKHFSKPDQVRVELNTSGILVDSIELEWGL